MHSIHTHPTSVFVVIEGQFRNVIQNMRRSPQFWVDELNPSSPKLTLLFHYISQKPDTLFAWNMCLQIHLNIAIHWKEYYIKCYNSNFF